MLTIEATDSDDHPPLHLWWVPLENGRVRSSGTNFKEQVNFGSDFDAWTLDTDRRLLSHGAEAVSLSPKASIY